MTVSGLGLAYEVTVALTHRFQRTIHSFFPSAPMCLPCARRGNTRPLSLEAYSLVERQTTQVTVIVSWGKCYEDKVYLGKWTNLISPELSLLILWVHRVTSGLSS